MKEAFLGQNSKRDKIKCSAILHLYYCFAILTKIVYSLQQVLIRLLDDLFKTQMPGRNKPWKDSGELRCIGT